VVLVALAGILSTLGAAALSGYWTNASVQRQFKSQRNAQIQDQRRQVYVDYIAAAVAMCAADETHNQAKQTAAGMSLINAYSRAQLIATPEVREPLMKLFDVISNEGCGAKIDPLSEAFIDAAKQELDEAG
jgi:hypothetical protein